MKRLAAMTPLFINLEAPAPIRLTLAQRAAFERLKQLNSYQSDRSIKHMIDLIVGGDLDGYQMLRERFNISSDVARKLFNDVTVEDMDVYERLETMMDDMGLPCPWPKVV